MCQSLNDLHEPFEWFALHDVLINQPENVFRHLGIGGKQQHWLISTAPAQRATTHPELVRELTIRNQLHSVTVDPATSDKAHIQFLVA